MYDMPNNVAKIFMDIYSQIYDGIKDKFTKSPSVYGISSFKPFGSIRYKFCPTTYGLNLPRQ